MRSAESGIYIILNTVNGKIYIGSAVNIKKRWYEHQRTLNKSNHDNAHLQAAWNKYGENAFQFKVLEYCSIDQLEAREDHFLSVYMPKGICYNIGTSAKRPTLGLKPSEETRRKQSEAAKHRPPPSEETRRKLSEASKGRVPPNKGKPSPLKGKRYNEEFRHKVSEANKGISRNKGKSCSEETRRKISEAKKGKPSFFKGKHLSEDHRRKLSEANKGRISPNKGKSPSEETRHKLRDSHKGQIAWNKGKPFSENILDKRRKCYIVTSPEGVEFEIKGLNKFCRENNLSPGAMWAITQGRVSQHKGWKCRKVEE